MAGDQSEGFSEVWETLIRAGVQAKLVGDVTNTPNDYAVQTRPLPTAAGREIAASLPLIRVSEIDADGDADL